MITIKNAQQIEKMRRASSIVSKVFLQVEKNLKAGISTLKLDKIIEDTILSNGASPNFKNYNGYKHASCISINDAVIHGIPNEYIIKDGDLVSVDLGCVLYGFHADSARSYIVGTQDKKAEKLVKVAKECFFQALGQCYAGRRLGDIGYAIEKTCLDNGFSVVKSFSGHGIGKKLHEDPLVPNCGLQGTGARLKAGYTLAIEPMIALKSGEVFVDNDGWTVRTRDGSIAAHYENVVLITNGEPEILWDGEL